MSSASWSKMWDWVKDNIHCLRSCSCICICVRFVTLTTSRTNMMLLLLLECIFSHFFFSFFFNKYNHLLWLSLNEFKRAGRERAKESCRCFAFIRYTGEGKRSKKCLTPTFFFSAVECNWSFYYCCQLKEGEKTRTSESVLLGKWTLFGATMLEFFECSLSGTDARDEKRLFFVSKKKKSDAVRVMSSRLILSARFLRKRGEKKEKIIRFCSLP